jgi:hypothetical protein
MGGLPSDFRKNMRNQQNRRDILLVKKRHEELTEAEQNELERLATDIAWLQRCDAGSFMGTQERRGRYGKGYSW